MRKLLITVLVVIAVLLSGCTYDSKEKPQAQATSTPTVTGTETAPPEVTNAQNTASVEIKGFAFNPASITVKKGTTVTWKQQDSAPHTITGTGFESGNLAKGQAFSHTFNDAGTFDYHCSLHPSMKGKVIVE
jgi:plastocyanin